MRFSGSWRRRLAAAIGALAALYVAFVAGFNLWRAPANVFDEVANGLLDSVCEKAGAQFFIAPKHSAILVGSLLNPVRTPTVGEMGGLERDPDITGARFGEELGFFGPEYYYTCSIYHPIEGTVLSCGGKEYVFDELLISTSGDGERLHLGFWLSDADGGERLYGSFRYSREGREADTSVYEDTPENREVVESAVEAAVFGNFLPAYFEAAGPSSAFSMDDLGEWGYEEDERRWSLSQ